MAGLAVDEANPLATLGLASSVCSCVRALLGRGALFPALGARRVALDAALTAALACLLAARAYKLTQREAATLLSAAAVPNVIIIGLPLYEALFGADVLPYLLIAALPQILLVMPLLVLLYVCVPNISPTKGELVS